MRSNQKPKLETIKVQSSESSIVSVEVASPSSTTTLGSKSDALSKVLADELQVLFQLDRG